MFHVVETVCKWNLNKILGENTSWLCLMNHSLYCWTDVIYEAAQKCPCKRKICGLSALCFHLLFQKNSNKWKWKWRGLKTITHLSIAQQCIWMANIFSRVLTQVSIPHHEGISMKILLFSTTTFLLHKQMLAHKSITSHMFTGVWGLIWFTSRLLKKCYNDIMVWWWV